MELNNPEVLKRRMYDGAGAMAVDRPEITQENDVEAPFIEGPQSGIPPWLLAEIHRPPSVNMEPEVPEDQEAPEVEIVDADKVTEENPNSRFRVVDTATLKPGTCILCKSEGTDGRQFVDLGIQVTWIGALYFCTVCLTEAAALLNLRSSLDYDSHIAGLLDSQNIHVGQIAELREQLNASRILLRNCHCGDSVPSYSDVVDVQLVEEADESASDSIADSNESGSVEESGDISDAGSDESTVEPEPAAPKRSRSRRQPSADE